MGKMRTREAVGIRTLDGIVRDFRKRLGPEGPMEAGYMQWIRESGSLNVAIDRSVMSTKPDGKRHNHQSRVKMGVLMQLGVRLKREGGVIRGFNLFDDLLTLVTAVAPKGIGPVTAYDVAQRVGEYLNVYPERVYLHAGVRVGAVALLGREVVGMRGGGFLLREDFPPELHTLTCNEIEDLVCIYSHMLGSIRYEGKGRSRG